MIVGLLVERQLSVWSLLLSMRSLNFVRLTMMVRWRMLKGELGMRWCWWRGDRGQLLVARPSTLPGLARAGRML